MKTKDAKSKSVLTALGFVVVFIALGISGKEDHQTYLAERMIEHCEGTEPDCSTLIGEVEKGGKFEVMSNGYDHFWVEERHLCSKDCGKED